MRFVIIDDYAGKTILNEEDVIGVWVNDRIDSVGLALNNEGWIRGLYISRDNKIHHTHVVIGPFACDEDIENGTIITDMGTWTLKRMGLREIFEILLERGQIIK